MKQLILAFSLILMVQIAALSQQNHEKIPEGSLASQIYINN